jgi:hypothetical protein
MNEIADRLGPGAFTILYPPDLGKGNKAEKAAASLRFGDKLREVMGVHDEDRRDVRNALSVLMNPHDPYGDVFVQTPGRGVTVVNPANVEQDAQDCVRNCGPSVAAALGEIVSALARPNTTPYLFEHGAPKTPQ